MNNVKTLYKHLLFCAVLSFIVTAGLGPAWAKPQILDSGMTPEKKTWTFTGERDYQADSVFKFWLKVSRAGNLNAYGTFDYNFNTKVIRPDGKEVWNTNYGFDENGYQQIEFSLPALFYERSNDRSEPDLGVWKIRVSMTENNTGKEVESRDFLLTFNRTDAARGGEGVIYLSDMKEISTGDIHGGLGKDRPYWQPELIIGGRQFKKGLVTHPVAENGKRAFVEYRLDGKYKYFVVTVGAAGDHGNFGKATMNYYIILDGKEVAGGRYPVPPDTKEIRIPVNGVKILRLEADNGGDGNNSDHAAWGDARLEK